MERRSAELKVASFAANATRTSNAASGCPAAISLFGSNFKLSSSFSSTYSKATLRKCTAVRLSLIFLNPSDNAMQKLKVSSRSEEHTSELQSLMRISYAVFCLKKKKQKLNT